MRSIFSIATNATFLASRMPLVNQQRSPHTSLQTTLTVPKWVTITAFAGRSCRSNEIDLIRVLLIGMEGRPDTLHASGLSEFSFLPAARLEAHRLERFEGAAHGADFPFAEATFTLHLA